MTSPTEKIRRIVMSLAFVSLALSASVALAQEKDLAADSTCGNLEEQSEPKAPSNAKWIMKTQVQQEARLFEHESFKTRSIFKSSVDYFRNGDETHKIAYEDLWFNDGKALGLQRKSSLDLPQNKLVDIEVKTSPCPSILESRAAAGTIMRLALDLRINHDQINRVTVPFNSFNAVSSKLQDHNFHVIPKGSEVPKEAAIVLNLQADLGSAKETLYYSSK